MCIRDSETRVILRDQPQEAPDRAWRGQARFLRKQILAGLGGCERPVEGLRGVGVGILGRKAHVSRKEVENAAQSGSTTNPKRKDHVRPTQTRPRTFPAHYSPPWGWGGSLSTSR